MPFEITKLDPFGVMVHAGEERPGIDAVSMECIRELFLEHQLVVLRGFESFTTAESFAESCKRFGEISVWPFGEVLELVEHENPTDHIFDSNYVPLHWDGMYRPQIAEYQIFHCVQAPRSGQGGRTTFSNTRLVLERARDEDVRLWKQVTGRYARKMEFYDSVVRSPIVVPHPYRDFSVIRYNEPPSNENGPFLNPPELEFSGLSEGEISDFHLSLSRALHAKENHYAHEWQTGDVVIADNLTLLHGREAFTSGGPRHLRRVHVLGETPLENSGLESHR